MDVQTLARPEAKDGQGGSITLPVATLWKGSIRSASRPDKQRSLRPQSITCCATATADWHPPWPGCVPLGAYCRPSASYWQCNE